MKVRLTLRGARAPGSGGPKKTRFSHSLLTKSKGRGPAVVKQARNYFSEANTARQQTSSSKTVSEAPKMLPGLYKENVGRRSVGACRWAVAVKTTEVLGSLVQGLPGSGQCLPPERVFSWGPVPAGSFA